MRDFLTLPLFNTLIGVVIGTVITYFVQTRTQRRAWKREYSVKIVEEVYAGLFKDLKSVIEELQGKYARVLSFRNWREIQTDHKYFMVEDKFRKRLDNLSEKLKNLDNLSEKLERVILPKIINQETKRIYNVESYTTPRIEVRYEKNDRDVETSLDMISSLVTEAYPVEHVVESVDRSEISNVRCFINVQQRDGKPFRDGDLTKFEGFWQSCVRTMKEDGIHKFIVEEKERLLDEAKEVRKELVKRIEETWRI